MKKLLATAFAVSMATSVAAQDSINSGSNSSSGSANALTIEGSWSTSVGTANNTAPCQVAVGGGVAGLMGIANSYDSDWCVAEEIAQTMVSIQQLTGKERIAAVTTLCTLSEKHRIVLVALGECVVRE